MNKNLQSSQCNLQPKHLEALQYIWLYIWRRTTDVATDVATDAVDHASTAPAATAASAVALLQFLDESTLGVMLLESTQDSWQLP